jgi:putative pyridoxal-dependent aspartate 1-decarboxylase
MEPKGQKRTMNKKPSIKVEKELVANWQTLRRIFISPESEASRSVLVKYMRQILFGLHEFLNTHVGVTKPESLKDMSNRFRSTVIKDNPEKKLEEVITDLIEDIAPHAVNVASPYFIGHMTSAIPFFMVHLKAIVTALNQNVVKLETSKVVSVIEKQVLAKIHRLFYGKDEDFYDMHVQDTQTTLGCFVEDGTLANITALWIARDQLLLPTNGFKGVEKDGLHAAYKAYGIDRCVILVSRLCHFSLRKAGGLLGIGNKNVIAVDVDKNNRIDLNALKKTIESIRKDKKVKTKIIAIVGIAGTTETGTIDPLYDLGQICKKEGIYFHIDAAWGGPTIMSSKYKHLLYGIELADSITVDGHKQLFMPMTCGMVYFNNPKIMDHVIYHAKYVNRPGSVDLGIKSIAGSREACSLILDSTLKIIGKQGYALLIDHGIETAKKFAKEINKRQAFQLITPPELNILTYRVCPVDIQQKLVTSDDKQKRRINDQLNEINRSIQIMQREAGDSFVSRTTLYLDNNGKNDLVVLRCVIMNPMTNMKILNKILDEQEQIYKDNFT